MLTEDLVKSQIQDKIVFELPTQAHGLLLLSPRAGKTKIVLDVLRKEKPEKVLWVTSQVRLRDVDIPEEFRAWGMEAMLENTDILCYQALKEVTGYYDKIILDEYQHATPANTDSLLSGTLQYGSILGISGTHPKHREKQEVYDRLGLKVLHEMTIDEAVGLGIVAPYKITVVECMMERFVKNVVVGKLKKFATTEFANYQYLTSMVEQGDYPNSVTLNTETPSLTIKRETEQVFSLGRFKAKFDCLESFIIRIPDASNTFGSRSAGYVVTTTEGVKGKIELDGQTYRISGADLKLQGMKFVRLMRMSSIHKSPSKLAAARAILAKLTGRTLVFSGNIETAEAISPNTYHSKVDDINLQKFMNKEVNELSCVNSGGIGFTYTGVDNFLIVQSNSNRRGDISQKIARSLMKQDNYEANIIIIQLKDTVDAEWVEKSLESFNPERVTRVSLHDFLTKV